VRGVQHGRVPCERDGVVDGKVRTQLRAQAGALRHDGAAMRKTTSATATSRSSRPCVRSLLIISIIISSIISIVVDAVTTAHVPDTCTCRQRTQRVLIADAVTSSIILITVDIIIITIIIIIIIIIIVTIITCLLSAVALVHEMRKLRGARADDAQRRRQPTHGQRPAGDAR